MGTVKCSVWMEPPWYCHCFSLSINKPALLTILKLYIQASVLFSGIQCFIVMYRVWYQSIKSTWVSSLFMLYLSIQTPAFYENKHILKQLKTTHWSLYLILSDTVVSLHYIRVNEIIVILNIFYAPFVFVKTSFRGF